MQHIAKLHLKFQQLDKDMKQPYDPHLPIENLFDQIETAKGLAQAANAPYAEAKALKRSL